jgi:hypothetical protein
MAYGSHPPVNEEGRAIGAWNLPTLCVEEDFDNVSPEHLFIASNCGPLKNDLPGSGLPAGPSELCYSLHFEVPLGEPEGDNGLCVAPYLWPPAGTWTFVDGGGGYPPDFCGRSVPSEAEPVAEPACFPVVFDWICGDADHGGFVNITDMVYLLSYIFRNGPEPIPYEAGDVDCNGFVNISDVVYVKNYIFLGGPEPCAACP